MAARAKEWAVKTAPGFGACLVLGLLAQAIAKLAPAVGAALFTIALGMVCGNTFLNRPAFDEGSKFSERSLLEYSIVLTGGTLVLSDILALGLGGVAFILCQMALTVAAAKFVSGQFEIIALAAIGMRVKFRDLVREGPRALSYGLLVGGCQVLFALGLIRLLLG